MRPTVLLALTLLCFACKKEPSAPACGDGTLDPKEQCDDGNRDDADGCQADCTLPSCGDGVLDLWEACDAGAENSDTPDAACRTVCALPRCGDAIADPSLGEVCDDGNLVDGDGCSPDCQSDERCGNGVVDPGEDCDDGGALSNDGCASDCVLEHPQWRLYDPQTAPTFDVSMPLLLATDHARGQVVVYDPEGTTWRLDGAGWHVVEGHGPLPSWGTAIAPDVARGDLVVFGGSHGGSFSNETWLWNGASWRQVHPPVSPPARNQHAMTWDAGRGVVVLFGGFTGPDEPAQDVWEWDGATWTERTSSPAPYGLATLGYDPVRDQVVAVDFESETWLWDGSSWAPAAPAAVPGTGAMSWDPVRERLVLTSMDGILEWNGTTWTTVGSVGPLYFAGHGTWDPIARKVLLLSGTNTISTWDGQQLEPRAQTVERPLARWMHSAAYHDATGSLVLAAGLTVENFTATPQTWPEVFLDETWLFDMAGWRRGPAGPTGRRAGLAHDPVLGELVLFPGGVDNLETWTFDGADWALQTPLARPERHFTALGWDPQERTVVSFGGYRNQLLGTPGELPQDDTWTWNGSEWTERLPLVRPEPRGVHHMATDAALGRLVVNGGEIQLAPGVLGLGGTVWSWHPENARWEVETAHPGSGRVDDAMAYDAHRKRLVRHGGHDPWDVTNREGVLELDRDLGWIVLDAPDGPAASLHPLTWHSLHRRMVVAVDGETHLFGYGPVREACTTGIDGDGDGLGGCDDPDCWGWCTPSCAPGADCDPTLPSCGDGVCNEGLETPRICPSDCGTEPVCGDFYCDPGETGCPGDCG